MDNLRRSFNGLTAVDGVSFEVYEGELFGFLGPNGAGKTTTINMLCTLLRPSGGTARVAGHDVIREQNAVRQSIGLIFQDPTLDERLTGLQNLKFHALLYDVSPAVFAERSTELLEMVDLADRTGSKVRTYSGGMRRRLEIARGLLHRPRVLFLDEPTIGLDPQTRMHIWNYLNRVRASEGTTLFLTTHYMDEAERCDRIAIIDHGEIIALDTPDNLKALVGGDLITLDVAAPDTVAAILEAELGLTPRPGPDGTLVVEAEAGGSLIPRIVAVLDRAGRDVESVNLSRPTLEDVFIKLTGRTIREESVDSGLERMRAMARRH